MRRSLCRRTDRMPVMVRSVLYQKRPGRKTSSAVGRMRGTETLRRPGRMTWTRPPLNRNPPPRRRDVPLPPPRPYWAVWQEGGRYPNVIIELTSPSTEREDRTTKWTLYERTFRTPEYFIYDFDTGRVEGWRLSAALAYEPIPANDRG